MTPLSLETNSQSPKEKIKTHQESEAEFPSLEEYIASLKEHERSKKVFSTVFSNFDLLNTLARLTSQQILKLRSDGKKIDGILSLGSKSSKLPNETGDITPFQDCLERLTYYYTIQDDPENSFKVVNIGLEAEGYESRSEKFNYIQKVQLIPADSESPDFQEEADKILPKNCKNIILMLNFPESFVIGLTEEYIKRGGKYIVGTCLTEFYHGVHSDADCYKDSPNFALLEGKKIQNQSEFECNDEIELPEYLKGLDEEYCNYYYYLLKNSLSTSIPISPEYHNYRCFNLEGEFNHELFLEGWEQRSENAIKKYTEELFLQKNPPDPMGKTFSNMSFAFVNNSTMPELNFSNKLFINSQLLKINASSVNFSESNFRECIAKNSDFSRSNFSKVRNFKDAKFSDCNFYQTNFTGANLCYGNFTNISFQEANFTNADLSFAKLKNCDFRDANLTGVVQKLISNNDLDNALKIISLEYLSAEQKKQILSSSDSLPNIKDCINESKIKLSDRTDFQSLLQKTKLNQIISKIDSFEIPRSNPRYTPSADKLLSEDKSKLPNC